jgi:hypothetical protein
MSNTTGNKWHIPRRNKWKAGSTIHNRQCGATRQAIAKCTTSPQHGNTNKPLVHETLFRDSTTTVVGAFVTNRRHQHVVRNTPNGVNHGGVVWAARPAPPVRQRAYASEDNGCRQTAGTSITAYAPYINSQQPSGNHVLPVNACSPAPRPPQRVYAKGGAEKAGSLFTREGRFCRHACQHAARDIPVQPERHALCHAGGKGAAASRSPASPAIDLQETRRGYTRR